MSMLFYVTFLLLVHLSGSNASCELSSFYSSIPELSNGKPTTRDGWESVLNKLNNLLEDTHVTVPYTSTSTDVWDALRVLDRDPSNSSNVWLLYANRTEPYATNGLTTGWNREHLIPRSYGLGESGPDFSDLHNLRAEDANVNSARNNLYYDDCYPSQDATCDQPAHIESAADSAKNSFHFMPSKKDKGDIARGVFYMAVRYNGSTSTVENMRLGDCPCVLDHVFGNLTTLLQWSTEDVVSDREAIRNNLTCTLFQNNRNPFVDFDWLQEAFLVDPPLSMIRSDCAADYGGDPDDCSDEQPITSAAPSTAPTLSVPTVISTGGVAIIGINSDNPDSFGLVALERVIAGSVLYVTDKGYDGSTFRSSEGVLAFTVSSDIPAGSTWHFEDGASMTNAYGTWTSSEGSFLLSVSGDQIFVFINSLEEPEFIFGVSNGWESDGSSLSASTTVLPTSLNTTGAYVTLGNADNARYAGNTTGTRNDLLTEISSVANWETSSSAIFSMTFDDFTVEGLLTCFTATVHYR
mmetsp:Transcript_4287/g.7291  ORF Transcript_4287/g.7291 Transcript_4287/m.7291 type:complete len:522 (-) Transcript_4287:304-1869(-)